MIDFSNLDSAKQQYRDIVLPLFDLIEQKGGYVARSAIMEPEVGYQIATSDKSNPWIPKYFGTKYSTWDEVVTDAIEMADLDIRRLSITDPMRNLINTIKRQRSTNNRIAEHSLSSDMSACGRLLTMIRWSTEVDDVYYSSNMIDDATRKHILEYLYKFSPLSAYHGPLWLKNARGYADTRKVTIDQEGLNSIAETIVELQRRYGILDHIGKLKPASLEDTQMRARENNPSNAHSLPTMTNGKNDDARAEQLQLAYEYKQRYKEIGVMPFVGAARVQQGGNVLRDLISELDSSWNWETTPPTVEQVEAALELAWNTRPRTTYYKKDVPSDFNPRWMRFQQLPQDKESREALVDNGQHDACILLRNKPTTLPDGSDNWKFNFMIEEATPWKLILDDPDLPDEVRVGWEDVMLDKNRVVFAGSGPTTLNQEAFTHVYKDHIKQYSTTHGHGYLSDPWHEPNRLLNSLTNMWAAVNDQPNSDSRSYTLTEAERAVAGKLSGDDKSSFDNFQAYFFHSTFNACMMAPLFGEEHHELMSYLSLQTLFPRLITFDGIYLFSESMPSGHGTTNDQDTFISQVAGSYDTTRRTKVRPSERFRLYDKLGSGMEAQGDDYEGLDSEEIDGDAKQESFDNLGLIVSVSKSLISKQGMEFVRYFSAGLYRLNRMDSGKDILALHHPFSHAFVKVNFGEQMSSNPPAVEDIANISRLNNMQFHPKFVKIASNMIPYTKLGMGCRNEYYVPQYLVDAWRSDGSPKPPSKYHVLIDSPMKLNEVAASEAEHMGKNLAQLTKSWTAIQYGEGKFEDLNAVKVLVALMNGDEQFIRDYESQFYELNI